MPASEAIPAKQAIPAKRQSHPVIYHDGAAIYLEFPTYALRFPYAEGGLAKALRHIPKVPSIPHKAKPGNIPDRAASASGKIAKIAPATARAREASTFSPEVRLAAADIVRKMGGGKR